MVEADRRTLWGNVAHRRWSTMENNRVHCLRRPIHLSHYLLTGISWWYWLSLASSPAHLGEFAGVLGKQWIGPARSRQTCWKRVSFLETLASVPLVSSSAFIPEHCRQVWDHRSTLRLTSNHTKLPVTILYEATTSWSASLCSVGDVLLRRTAKRCLGGEFCIASTDRVEYSSYSGDLSFVEDLNERFSRSRPMCQRAWKTARIFLLRFFYVDPTGWPRLQKNVRGFKGSFMWCSGVANRCWVSDRKRDPFIWDKGIRGSVFCSKAVPYCKGIFWKSSCLFHDHLFWIQPTHI